MKKLALGAPSGPSDIGWAHRALKTIERASYEDIEQVMDDYTITGTVTEVRTLSATESNQDTIRDFLLTMVQDLQKRGQNRSIT
jgi:hypothetical protein